MSSQVAEPSPLKPTTLDPEQERALELLKGNNHVIIAGGGGTGKTHIVKTYLKSASTSLEFTSGREIKVQDRAAVATPTGVAASLYDAEGAVTIYNLFGFPASVNRSFIAGSWRPAAAKRRVLETIKVLILDEFSMIRADLLDMIDQGLRKIRRSSKPFGGVRLVLVGDPAQLPPIVKPSEERIFSAAHGGYGSQYVVSSDAFAAIAENTDVCVLTRQHRQEDPEFAKVVSDLRAGTQEDIARAVSVLNTRVQPDFTPDPEEGFVTFTATRYLADQINDSMTEHLDGVRTFQAEVSGDSSKVLKGVQAPENLRIAKGSQVMMLTNDKDKRWVNGTVGIVTHIGTDPVLLTEGLKIKMASGTHFVHRHEWKVTTPVVKTYRDRSWIEHDTLGSFTQFPVLPSWATTIHKSQGRTCDKVILDTTTGVFAEGQAYVGVSRCTSLEGLVLRTPLSVGDVQVPAVARWFDDWAVAQSPAVMYGATQLNDEGEMTSAAFVVMQGTRTLGEVSTRVGQVPLPTETGIVELVERVGNGLYYAGDPIPGFEARALDLEVDVSRFFDVEGEGVLNRARALAAAARSIDIRDVILEAGPDAIIAAQYRNPCPVVAPEKAHEISTALMTGADAQDWFDTLYALTSWAAPGDHYYQAQAYQVGATYAPVKAPASM